MRIRGRDRISFLPDEIIGHILSFLPTKYAVQTSVLSKRWQYLWTFITSFDFKDNVSDERNLACIARRILTCCSSKMINKFSLTLNSYICTLCLDACIDELCKRNVCELRLKGPLVNYAIFTWKTLTALDLKSDVIVLDTEDIPTFDLPKLKKLRTRLFYPSSDLSEKLFSSCPVLEDLTIEGTVRSETKFNLSCPLLKRLKIQLQAWDFEGLKYKFVINAPNLKYLELIDMFKAEYVVENLTSVVEAKLNMRQGAADEIFGNLAAELLWAFRNLQSLSIDEDCLAVLNDPGRRDLPTFKDMKRLELFVNDYSDQEMIAPLLNVCPNLESLILFESFAEGEKSRAHQRYMETCGLELVPINVMGLKIFLLEVVISVMAPRINSSKTRPS